MKLLVALIVGFAVFAVFFLVFSMKRTEDGDAAPIHTCANHGSGDACMRCNETKAGVERKRIT